MQYTPCQSLCDKLADVCPGCGRTRHEINTFKEAIQSLVSLAIEMGYENIDEYADSAAAAIKKKTAVQLALKQRSGS